MFRRDEDKAQLTRSAGECGGCTGRTVMLHACGRAAICLTRAGSGLGTMPRHAPPDIPEELGMHASGPNPTHDVIRTSVLALRRGDDYTERAVLTRVLSLTMLLVSVLMALWGGYNFQKRAVYLDAKMDGPYDSRALPLLLTIVMVLSMSIVFGGAIMRLNEPAAA